MATRITITNNPDHVEFHVTDDTGRDQKAKFPRYPAPGSEEMADWVTKLDHLMYKYADGEGGR